MLLDHILIENSEKSNSIDQKKNTDSENSNNSTLNKFHVKLFKLNEQEEWDDKGKGYLYFYDKDENNNLEPKLIIIKENSDEELLNLNLNNNIEFNNQRGTILTFKLKKDCSKDNIAISFLNREGIKEIWKKICCVYGNDYENFFNEDNNENIFEVSIANLPNLEKEIKYVSYKINIIFFFNIYIYRIWIKYQCWKKKLKKKILLLN